MKFQTSKRNHIKLILIIFSTVLLGQQYTLDHVIVNGGANIMSGYLAPAVQGEERVEGSLSILVGQPFVSPQPMTNGSISTELGYWSFLKRTPETPKFHATYDIYPDRIDLDWDYDPNIPSASISHRIFRNDVLIRDNYSTDNAVYVDDSPELNVGTEYNYGLKGRNSFGWVAENAEAVGKTSTVGSISGNIATSLGTKIPHAKLVLEPNWGYSIYCDGASNYVSIPDGDEFEFGDHSTLPNATIELWIDPYEVANDPILAKGSEWKLSLVDVSGYIKLRYSVSGTTVLTTDASIAVGAWTHISMVKETSGSSTSIRIYLNGEPVQINSGQTSTTVISNLQGADQLTLGQSGSDYYKGYIDDIRIWDIARTAADIALDFDRYLYYRTLGAINYPDLKAQFTMDNGSGSIITNAVDQSKNGAYNNLTQNTWSGTIPPAYATAYTDFDGNYQINNINYGDGTNYTLTPSKPYHEFNPTYRLVYLSNTVPVSNGQNFTVTNLMSITGYVYFDSDNTEGVQCGEEFIQIWVNDEFKGIMTNDEGFYRVELEPGADAKIQPFKASREYIDFTPPELNFTNVISNQTGNFIDTKTRTLRGSVTGGACEYPLGPPGLATVTLSAPSLFAKTANVQASGDYVFTNMPPQFYQLAVDIDVAGLYSPPIPGDITEMDQHFAQSGVAINTEDSYSQIDSSWAGEEDTVKFNYRSDMQVDVLGFNINELGDNMVSQNIADTITLFAYEEYWGNPSYSQCPIDSGSFTIFDYISDRWTPSSDTVQVEFGDDGSFEYVMMPGQPNISDAGAHPYHKTIEIVAEDGLGRTLSILNRAVVLGHKPQQMDFTTTAPDIPMLILRRPPGDASSSYFSTGQSQCTELEVSTTEQVGMELGMVAKLGVGVTTSVGFGVMTEINVEATYELEAGLSLSQTQTSTTSQSLCIECETSYSTGEVMGSGGDLFVGGALNLLYGVTKVLSIEEFDAGYEYTLTDEVIFVPYGFETTFIYTHKYIDEILIPELIYLSQTDSTMLESVDRWEGVLARENSLRWETQDTTNYSFEGGAGEFSVSRSSEVTESMNYSTELQLDASLAQTVGFSVNDAAGLEATVGFNFGFGIGQSSTSTTTHTNTSAFTLDDDDFGDDFTVGVGNDPVYGTPVFHVVAGHSSCPYEVWENEQGAVVTIPRDVPFMEWQTPSEVHNVLPNQAALMTVLLRNDQDGIPGSDERVYYLSTVESSNPRGAIVMINGQIHDEMNPLPYTFGIGEGDTAQIAIYRGVGDYYEYENLLLKFAPECEAQAGVTEGFTLPFTVNFARPCTEAEIYDPSENWVINLFNDDTLDIVVTGYDLNQSHFDELWLQYKQQGSDVWYTIDNATLIADTLRVYGQTTALMHWPVQVLNDGIYDMRLRTICLEGLLTNEMQPLRGTIDREMPTVLGAPEPVDEVLNMNDEIAVNFTEEIDPATVYSNNVILFDGQGQGQITDIEVSVSENRLVIEPQVANDQIENHFLDATIYGYYDMFGNPGDTVAWSFMVNQNPISWNIPAFNTIAWVGDIQGFDVALNNIGSSAKPFEIVDLPDWLIVTPMVGEINPGGTFTIHFDIDPNLNVGEYSDFIYADTPDGMEPLRVDIVSMCHYPEWIVDPTEYEYSMNITAQLFVKGTQSLDVYDRLGAFINDECRGFVNVEYDAGLDNHLAYLTVYSSEYSGEPIEFHIWDRTGCVEYWEVDTILTFVSDTYIGTPMDPLPINANGAVAQNIELVSGYTWFSTNLQSQYLSNLDTLFENFTLTNNDRIIGQDSYAQYSESLGSWTGPLANTGLELVEMYMSDIDSMNTLDIVGFSVGPDTMDIIVDAGWNWLGFVPNLNQNVNQALNDHASTTDDLIKDQFSFALYVDGLGWLGSLDWMYPGYGYKLSSALADTFNYPVEGSMTVMARTVNENLPESLWVFNSMKFKNNMSITFLIDSDTLGINNPADVVAAFVDDEIRGVARPLYISVLEQYRIFMMIYGNPGETVSFKIYESGTEITYHGNEILTFHSDEIIGTPLQPLILTKAALGISDFGYVPDVYSLSQNFPNPFNPITKLGFGIPEDGLVSIRIFNLLGQEIKTLVRENLEAGYRFVVWNSTNDYGNQVTSGVYFVVMECNNFREVRKMVLLK